jgi:selenoprotein W-related protein
LPRAASLAAALLGRYKNRLGEVALVPSQGGAFEISLNGESIYSKLETGRFPNEGALVKQVAAKI